jgi:hypothetical protein
VRRLIWASTYIKRVLVDLLLVAGVIGALARCPCTDLSIGLGLGRRGLVAFASRHVD